MNVHLFLQVMIWNLDSPEQVIKNPVRTIKHHTDVVLSMSFNTDGSLLATTCRDRKIRLMEARSGNMLQVKYYSFSIFTDSFKRSLLYKTSMKIMECESGPGWPCSIFHTASCHQYRLMMT